MEMEELLAAIAGMKEMVEDQNKTFAAMQAKLDEMEGGSNKDPLDDEQVAKMNANISELTQKMNTLAAEKNRPAFGAAGRSEEDKEYKKAFFHDYMLKGNDRYISTKSVNTVNGADGGFAVPEYIDKQIENKLREASPMRSIVKVISVPTSDYKKLVSVHGNTSGWVGEEASRDVTASPRLQEISITPGEIYSQTQATQRALDDMMFDGESWITQEALDDFALQESIAIVGGDGINKPKGFLTGTTSTDVDDVRTFGQLQVVKTGAAGAFGTNPFDTLIDLMHALRAGYRQDSSWVMNSLTLAEIRKMKDAEGRPLWSPDLSASFSGTLLGRPIVEVEQMPDIAAGSLAVAYGDFNRGYTMVERLGTRVLRDPYSSKPYVQFYATRRVGGAVVNDDAIKLLQFGA